MTSLRPRAEAHVRSQASLCEIWIGQSVSGIGFSRSTSLSPWQHHSTYAPHSFHSSSTDAVEYYQLTATLNNSFLPPHASLSQSIQGVKL